MDLAKTIPKCLNDAQISLTTHKRGAKTLCAVRNEDPETFLPTFCNAILPVLLEYKVRLDAAATRTRADDTVSSFVGCGRSETAGNARVRCECDGTMTPGRGECARRDDD